MTHDLVEPGRLPSGAGRTRPSRHMIRLQALARRACGMPLLFLALAAVVFFLPVLANPGYWSHDELSKADHVIRYGLDDYMRRYVRIRAGDHFGVPVRPVAFAVQGLVAPFMAQWPVVVHAVDVLMHLTATWLLYLLVARLSTRRDFALLAALVFLVCPLTVPSVVWPAALMDRLFVLWGLAAFLAFERWRAGAGMGWLLASASAVALAMGSKETAMMLPGALLVRAAWQGELLRERRTWMAFAAWCLPVVLFMLVRLPAVLISMRDEGHPAYTYFLHRVPEGVAFYLSFPFLPSLADAGPWPALDSNWILLALALHGALLAALAWRFGARTALAYLALYLLFLVPVLGIANRGGWYLYAAAVPFSLALAAFLLPGGGVSSAGVRLLAIGALVIAILHSAVIQAFGYQLGWCMSRAAASSEDAWLAAGRPPVVWFTAEPGARAHVLGRLFTDREQLGAYYPVRLLVGARPAGSVPPGTLHLRMSRSCAVLPAN